MKRPDIRAWLKSFTVPEKKMTEGFALISKYRSAIMGFAALWIIFFHEWAQVCQRQFPNYIETRAKRFGYGGVDIFFMLSGMGLTYAIGKSKLPVFYYRRLKRIILPFLAVAFVRMYIENWSWGGFIDNVTGRGFYTISIYCFLWFVPAIVTLYLLFPVYHKLFKAIGPYVCTAAAFLIWLLYTLGANGRQREDMFGFTNRIPIFLFGVLIGYLTQTKRELKFKRRYWLPIVLTFVLGLKFLEMTNFEGVYLVVPVSNCCFPTMLVALTLPFILAKVLNELERVKGLCIVGHALNVILTFFGGISLELYCVQEWYANLIYPKMWDRGFTPMQVNLAYLTQVIVISFIASVLFKAFWRLVELPFSRKKKNAPAEKAPAFENKLDGVVITEDGAASLNAAVDRLEAAAARIEAALVKLPETEKTPAAHEESK